MSHILDLLHSLMLNIITSVYRFDEEMIESLFGYTSSNKPKNCGKGLSSKVPVEYVRILDAKKSQNLAISLKALNVKIEVVRDALMEGRFFSLYSKTMVRKILLEVRKRILW